MKANDLDRRQRIILELLRETASDRDIELLKSDNPPDGLWEHLCRRVCLDPQCKVAHAVRRYL